MSKELPVGSGFETRFSTGARDAQRAEAADMIHLSEGEQWLQQMVEDDSNERRTAGAPAETVVGDGSAWT